MTFKITASEKQLILAIRKKIRKRPIDPTNLIKKIKSILRKSNVPLSKQDSAGRIRGYRPRKAGYVFKYVKDIAEIQVRLYGKELVIEKYRKELDPLFDKIGNVSYVESENIYVWNLLR